MEIKKIFDKGYCVDELFLQTLVWNSKEYFQLYNYGRYNDYSSCQRKIDWDRGKPYVWRSHDYAELMSSNYIFARKFDSRIDNEIVEKIFKKIKTHLEED